MSPSEKHLSKKWEVSLIRVIEKDSEKFKVTRRLPELSVSETLIFTSYEEAKNKFDEWLM